MAKESQKGTALKPLPAESLCSLCDPGQFSFATTAELDDQLEIAGQDRAVGAVRFALGMKQEGYNVFVLGPPGSGKHAVAKKLFLRTGEDCPVIQSRAITLTGSV